MEYEDALNYWARRLSPLFAIVILFLTVIASTTVSSGLGLLSHVPFLHKEGREGSTTITPAATTLFKITDRIKELIRTRVDNNKTNAAIVIGLVDPNGTQFYGYGKMSAANKTSVDQNSIFRIGSITKVW